MKHYYKEVKEVMRGEKTPEDFAIAIYGEDYSWAKLIAARRNFIEFPEGIRIDTEF